MLTTIRICPIAVLAVALSLATVGEAWAADAPPMERAAAPESVASDFPTSARLAASDTPSCPPASAQARPASWAQPVELKGAPNLFKVTDNLYRGAQPTAEGLRSLKKLGIKTIVNLRAFHSDRDEMGDIPFDYVHMQVKSWHPEDEDVIRFLRIATDPARQPMFVHCQHGADRTGTMCAIYRVAVQGWTKKEAIREMTEGGYGYHVVWANLVEYIEKLDIESIGKKSGVPPVVP